MTAPGHNGIRHGCAADHPQADRPLGGLRGDARPRAARRARGIRQGRRDLPARRKPRDDTGALVVSIRAGSLLIEPAPLPPAPTLWRDLQALLDSELLDAIDARRREVIARWQGAAVDSRQLAYRISAAFLPRPVTVSADTEYRSDDADHWVSVERYVRGEILDLGGATRANAHVRLPDGSTLKVTTERSVLRDETVNRLYKLAVLRISARYNFLTKQLRDARLIEFVEYAPAFDEAELERLTRRGAECCHPR